MGTRRENARMVFVTILGREPDARILGPRLSFENYYSLSWSNEKAADNSSWNIFYHSMESRLVFSFESIYDNRGLNKEGNICNAVRYLWNFTIFISVFWKIKILSTIVYHVFKFITQNWIPCSFVLSAGGHWRIVSIFLLYANKNPCDLTHEMLSKRHCKMLIVEEIVGWYYFPLDWNDYRLIRFDINELRINKYLSCSLR